MILGVQRRLVIGPGVFSAEDGGEARSKLGVRLADGMRFSFEDHHLIAALQEKKPEGEGAIES